MSLFSRTERLIGQEALRRLRESRVALFGLGGVGSYVAEALARSGIEHLLLVDGDVVSRSNLNRQLVALTSTIGLSKVEIMAQRARDINPAAEIVPRQAFYTPANADTFELTGYDYAVDAMDDIPAKVALAVRCKEEGVPIISCMGAGNKTDPTRFEVADIFDTTVCPLCKAMRRELRQRGMESLRVVYSREVPVTVKDGGVIGTLPFVPSVMGLVAASEVVRNIAGW